MGKNTYGGQINRPVLPTADTGSSYSGIWTIDEHYGLRRDGALSGNRAPYGLPYLSTTVFHLVPGTANDTNLIDGTGNHQIYQASDQPNDGGEYLNPTTPLGCYYTDKTYKYGPTSIRINPSSSFTALYTDKLNLSIGDWTIEWWEYRETTGIGVIIRWGLPGSYAAVMCGYHSAGVGHRLYISTTGTSWAVNGLLFGTSSLNKWTHYAATRNTTTNAVYVHQNGYYNGTATLNNTTAIKWPYGNLTICPAYPTYTANNTFGGYIEDLCISKRAKYNNTNFTPTRIIE